MDIEVDPKILEGLQQFFNKKDETQPLELCKMFGNNTPVLKLASFYDDNNNTLWHAFAAKLLDYCKEQTFDSKEYDAYRKGLTDFILLFVRACAEREQLKQRPESDPESQG